MIETQNIFRFELENERIVASAISGVTGRTLDVTDEMVDWRKLKFGLHRRDGHGIYFVITQPVTFTGKAARFVTRAFEAHTSEAQVAMRVFMQHQGAFRLIGKNYVDFGPYAEDEYMRNTPRFVTEENGALTVTVPLTPWGIAQKLFDRAERRVRMNQTRSVELVDLELPPMSEVLLKGKTLRYTLSHVIESQEAQTLGNATNTFADLNPQIVADGTFPDEVTAYIGNPPFATNNPRLSGLWFRLGGTYDVTIEYRGSVTIENLVPPQAGDEVTVGLIARSFFDDGNGGVGNMASSTGLTPASGVANLVIVTDRPGQAIPGAVPGQNLPATFAFSFTYNQIVTFQPGEALFLYFGCVTNDNVAKSFTFNIERGDITITRDAPQRDRRIRAHLVGEVMGHTLAAITDTPNVLVSELYGRPDSFGRSYADYGEESLKAIFNGFQARGMPNQKPVITSWKELYKDLDASDCIGFDVQEIGDSQQVRVQRREKYYLDEEFHYFTEVKGMSGRFADTECFSQLEAGIKSHLKEGVFNSLDTPHTPRVFESQHRSIRRMKSNGEPREYNAQMQVFALCAWMRQYQMNQGPSTTSADYDDQLFMECLLHAGDLSYFTEQAENFRDIFGVIDPATMTNLRKTPARMLRRHFAFLGAIFWKHPEFFYRLSDWSGNVELSTTSDDATLVTVGSPVQERADIPSTVAPIKYIPFKRKARVAITTDWLFAILQGDNRYRRLTISDGNDKGRTGWILDDTAEGGLDPAEGWMMDVTLILKDDKDA